MCVYVCALLYAFVGVYLECICAYVGVCACLRMRVRKIKPAPPCAATRTLHTKNAACTDECVLRFLEAAPRTAPVAPDRPLSPDSPALA